MPSSSLNGSGPSRATREDVEQILGEVEDHKIIEVLALEPTVAELEEAALWSHGEGDVLGKGGHELTGNVAAIFDILAADEEEDEERGPGAP